MQLGSVKYFIPFFFVLDTAFILRAPLLDIVYITTSAFAGVTLVAGGLQGYLVGVGNLMTQPLLGWPVRGLIIAGGLCLATPGGNLIPFSNLNLMFMALAFAGPGVLLAYWLNRTPGVEDTA